jgi:hypothetical protein
MDLMIANKKGEDDVLIVALQSNGYVVNMSCGETIRVDGLLFPKEHDENLSMYLSSSIQGLLLNPNVIKDTSALDEKADMFSIIFKAEELALSLCYDTPLTEFVPIEQSFLSNKANMLKINKVN